MKKIKTQPELNIIGQKIREVRIAKKLSQLALSQKLELIPVYICRASISRIEHGVRAITDIEIEEIEKVLNVSPNELFDWKQNTTK